MINEVNRNVSCPECGAPTEEIRAGRTSGTRCTNCGWSVVTTYTPPIEQDATQYAVHITNGDPHDKQQLKLIAQLMNCNFLQARELMQRNGTIVIEGKAPQILAVKKRLIDANFVITVEPSFKW